MSSCCCCPTCWADPSLPKPRFGTQNLAKQKFVIILLAFSLLPLLSIFPRVFMLFLSICNLRYSSFFPLISYFFTPFLFYLVSLFFTHPFPFFPSSVFCHTVCMPGCGRFCCKGCIPKVPAPLGVEGAAFPQLPPCEGVAVPGCTGVAPWWICGVVMRDCVCICCSCCSCAGVGVLLGVEAGAGVAGFSSTF